MKRLDADASGGGDSVEATTGGDGESEAGSAGEPADSASGGAASGSATGGTVGTPSGGAGALGGGGSGGTHGGTGANVDVIDDMEDEDAFVTPVHKRDGRWGTGNDATTLGVQTPPPNGDFMMKALDGDAPHADDLFAAYTKGGGFATWGAYLNVSMKNFVDYAKQPTYDASAFSGIAFYAKGSVGKSNLLTIRISTLDTDPRGGRCNLTTSASDACFDHFVITVALAATWQLYRVKFDDFYQQGTGKQYPAVDLTEMFGFEFYVPANNDFELWIDDLEFTER